MTQVYFEQELYQNQETVATTYNGRSALQMFCETVLFEWNSMPDAGSREVNVRFLLAAQA